MFISSKQELRNIKRHLKNVEFVHVVQYNSIKCKKRNHKYFVSREKLFTSCDIKLNPGPVVTQGNNPNNVRYWIYTTSISATWFENIRYWWCRWLFLKAMSHQLYGEPSYHRNIRSTGVQYTRNDPERFIESSTDHSWLRYLACLSQQGTWADCYTSSCWCI